MRVLFAILLLSLALSCSSINSDPKIIDFRNFQNRFELANGTQILKQDLGYGIYVVDTLIIVQQRSQAKEKYLYNVYNSNLEFLGSVGRYGSQAPNEFIGLSFSNQIIRSNDEIKIVLNDFPKSRLSILNLTKSLSSGETVIDSVITYHPRYDFSGNVFFGLKNSIVARQAGLGFQTNQYEIHFLDKLGDDLLSFGEYPEVLNLEPNEHNLQERVNSGYLKAKPDRSSYVSGQFFYDQLRIFDNEGKIVKTIRGNDFRFYDSETISDQNKSASEIKIFYRSLYASDNFIYCLVYNQPKGELTKKYIPLTIRVFDWSGNLKAIMDCPDYITTINVDEQHGYLYADFWEEQKFLRYDISSILLQLKGDI